MAKYEKSKEQLLKELRAKRENKLLKQKKRSRRFRITGIITLVCTITVIIGAAYSVSAKEITITEINEFTGLNSTHTVRTRGETAADVLAENGLDVSEFDKLSIPEDTTLNNNDSIVITRGKAVTIRVGDEEKTATITKADITDALVEAGYIPDGDDSVLSDGNTIELVSVSRMDEKVSETIERGIDYVDDPELIKGQEKVVDEGEDGVKEIQHKVTYLNGEESERVTTSETVAKEPRNKVIARGTAEPTPPPATAAPVSAQSSGKSTVTDNGGSVNGHKYSRKITMTATAYSASPSENAGYTTSAMGNPLRYGIVAVDPSVIPLGSTVYVTAPDGSWEYGVASAEDTGGAIKGNKIDLCYPQGGSGFGRRSCVVYVLE